MNFMIHASVLDVSEYKEANKKYMNFNAKKILVKLFV
jgi:hypothetical protein